MIFMPFLASQPNDSIYTDCLQETIVPLLEHDVCKDLYSESSLHVDFIKSKFTTVL